MAVHQVFIDPRQTIKTSFSLPVPNTIPTFNAIDDSRYRFSINNRGCIITGVLIVLVLGLLYYASSEDDSKKTKRYINQRINYF